MRIGLPLMLLTSLSVHLIVLLILTLAAVPPRGAGRGHDFEPPGPVVILSKELSPPHESASPSRALPPPPPPPVFAKASVPSPAPTTQSAPRAETILSGKGGLNAKGGVVFLLDISGSMYEAYAGVTRLTLARKLLLQQIEALPDGTPFAIAMYGETTRHSGPLVAASRTSRLAAEQYLMEDFDCGGGTNLPAGFDTAESLRPGSIVLVSDGDLNISDHLLLHETRRILGQPGPQLSVIGVAPRTGTVDAQQLEEVAREQAGSYQAMDVPRAR